MELQRFFQGQDGKDLSVEEFSFGKQLKAAGFTEEQIQAFVENKDFTFDGKTLSAFDGTEELDAAEAIKVLRSVL